MKNSQFYGQVELLLKCLPAVSQEKCFAMKGGTAINMFVRPMPRLSVDIDLTYVLVEDRATALQNISSAIERIAAKIEKTIPISKVQRTKRDGRIIKLVVSAGGSSIKIEPNEVLRGTTAPPVSMSLVKEAEDLFEMSVNFPIVPLPDLYGGKICAALDRQHPRDLFDVKVLLETDGLTDEVRKGFIVFLCCHDRPMHELIKPNLKDLTSAYQSEFKGMTSYDVTLESLYKARTDLIQEIHKAMTEDERKFLVSLKSGNPDWKLLNVDGVESLSGIQWKLQNIQKMTVDKRQEQTAKLQKVLGL